MAGLKTTVDALEVGNITVRDALEIVNWVGYLAGNGGYVPNIILELADSIGKELNLEGGDG